MRTSIKIQIVDASGNVVDFNSTPLSKYEPANKDDSGSPAYYGFVDISGNWYIMKDTSGAYTFYAGTSDYATNWTNRATITPYQRFDLVF